METLQMCRMCLVENVRMHAVSNKNLQGVYEKLTDIPFVTEDSRPMLACFICYAKLKQCCRLQRKCLESEELFAQMLSNYELKPSTDRGHLEFVGGFVRTAIDNISIVDDVQTERPIEIELPAVCETQYNIIEIKVEHQSDDELEPGNLNIYYPDIKPLMEIKPEMEALKDDTGPQAVCKNKRRSKIIQRASVAKQLNLIDGTSTAKQKKNERSGSKVNRTTPIRSSIPVTNCKNSISITKPRVFNNKHTTNLINSAIDTNFCNNGNEGDLKCKILNNKIMKEKLFKCDICQRSFSDKGNLRKHVFGHTGEKPFKCDLCQRSFNAKCHLDKHSRIHSGEKPYKCDICQRCFSEKSNLTKHIRRHTGDKPYKCDICQRSFNQKFHLESHSRLHTGEKPYKCKVCQQSFNRLYNLKQHFRVHTGEKPHNCDICQRKFNHKTSLVNHVRRHTGEKPYKCDICQRSFTHKQSLNIHVRKHTGEKPYKCEQCQRCFSQSAHLKQHAFTHTSIKP